MREAPGQCHGVWRLCNLRTEALVRLDPLEPKREIGNSLKFITKVVRKFDRNKYSTRTKYNNT